MIDIIFSGERSGILIDRVETRVKDFIFNKYPDYRNSAEVNIFLTYSIKGGHYAFMENIDYDMDILLSVIGDIAECVTQKIIGND